MYTTGNDIGLTPKKDILSFLQKRIFIPQGTSSHSHLPHKLLSTRLMKLKIL